MKHRKKRILSALKLTPNQEDSQDGVVMEHDRLASLLRLAEDEKLRLNEDKIELQQQIDTYRYAFETTQVDRDIWQERSASTLNKLAIVIKSYADLCAQAAPTSKQPLPVYGLPNFFCVGVQKTATSFLYSILRDHPLVNTAAKDTGALKRFVLDGSIEEYREELGEESDAPVFTHFDVNVIDCAGSAVAIRDRLCHDARILICVRNPIDRAVSEWKMRARTIRPSGLWAETLDFMTAVETESERILKDPVHHDYTGRSLYAEAIQGYFDTFGRENVHVIVMEEDLGDRTPVTLIKLFNFISLLDQDAMEIVSASHDQHKQASQGPTKVDIEYDGTTLKITSDKPNQLGAEVIDPIPEFVGHAEDLNNKQVFKLTDEQRRDLFKSHFEKDVTALESLLGRDLSCWRP